MNLVLSIAKAAYLRINMQMREQKSQFKHIVQLVITADWKANGSVTVHFFRYLILRFRVWNLSPLSIGVLRSLTLVVSGVACETGRMIAVANMKAYLRPYLVMFGENTMMMSWLRI